MAMKTGYSRDDFDHFVRLLIGRWEFALDLQGEWDSFDGEQRLVLTEDWSVNNDIHQHLADYVARHELSEEQKALWTRLNRLAAEHKKDLEAMGYRVRLPAAKKGRAAA